MGRKHTHCWPYATNFGEPIWYHEERLSRQPMPPPKYFDIPPEGECSGGLDKFRFFFKHWKPRWWTNKALPSERQQIDVCRLLFNRRGFRDKLISIYIFYRILRVILLRIVFDTQLSGDGNKWWWFWLVMVMIQFCSTLSIFFIVVSSVAKIKIIKKKQERREGWLTINRLSTNNIYTIKRVLLLESLDPKLYASMSTKGNLLQNSRSSKNSELVDQRWH